MICSGPRPQYGASVALSQGTCVQTVICTLSVPAFPRNAAQSQLVVRIPLIIEFFANESHINALKDGRLLNTPSLAVSFPRRQP